MASSKQVATTQFKSGRISIMRSMYASTNSVLLIFEKIELNIEIKASILKFKKLANLFVSQFFSQICSGDEQ